MSFVPFFGGLFEVPAVALVVAWFGLQLIPGAGNLASTDLASGGTAYLAHVGGFIYGVVTVRLFARGRGSCKRSAGPPPRVGARPDGLSDGGEAADIDHRRRDLLPARLRRPHRRARSRAPSSTWRRS